MNDEVKATILTQDEMATKVSEIPYDFPHMFSVVFTKKNGDLRHMTCRRGVQSRSKGVQAGEGKPRPTAYNFNEKRLLSVFDVNKEKEITGEDKKGAYRSINWDTVQQLKMDGKVFRTQSYQDHLNKVK